MRCEAFNLAAVPSRRIPGRRQIKLSSAALLMTAVLDGEAVAQTAVSSEGRLDEIVVTAERRTTSLQDVAASISALTGDDLKKSNINSTLDLQYSTPGLVLTTNGPFAQPYIRGVGSDIGAASFESTVAVHIDGVYLARPFAALQDFNDVERIEVLRGPQGTLYGRNASGGAINIISNRPGYDLSFGADLTYGNYDRKRGRAFLNAPIANGKIALRASLLGVKRDGYTKELFGDGTIDGENLWSGRAQVRFDPADNLTFIASYDKTREKSTRNFNAKANPAFPSLAYALGAEKIASPRTVRLNRDTKQDNGQEGISLRAEWNAGSALLSSLTAYRDVDLEAVVDIDATELDVAINHAVAASKTFQQELTLASQGASPLEWVLGMFYFREKARQDYDITIVPFGVNAGGDPNHVVTNAVAGFGQLSYIFAEKLRLTAGLRYSFEEKRSVTFNEALTTVVSRANFSDDAWSPKAGIDFFLNDDVMLYGTVTKGFKSGGFNGTTTVKAEKVWSYEAGIKSELLDKRLRVNASVFHSDYNDLQVQVTLPTTQVVIENADGARVRGVDLEVTAIPVDGLTLSVGAEYLDAKFTELVSVNPNNPTADPDQSGNRLPRAPKLSANLAAEYVFSIGESGRLLLRGEMRHQSKVYFDYYNVEGVSQGAYDLYNATVRWTGKDDRYYVAVFGRNLTDKLYSQSVVINGLVGNLNFFGAPRTFGVEVGVKF